MASERKEHANRQNAQKSTGPKTRRGKAHSSGNAVKHRLYQRQSRIRTSAEETDYQSLYQDAIDCYRPEGALEKRIVEQIVYSLEGLRLLDRVEIAQQSESVTLILRDRFSVLGLTEQESLKLAQDCSPLEKDIDKALAAIFTDCDHAKTTELINKFRQSTVRRLKLLREELAEIQKRKVDNLRVVERSLAPPPPLELGEIIVKGD